MSKYKGYWIYGAIILFFLFLFHSFWWVILILSALGLMGYFRTKHLMENGDSFYKPDKKDIVDAEVIEHEKEK